MNRINRRDLLLGLGATAAAAVAPATAIAEPAKHFVNWPILCEPESPFERTFFTRMRVTKIDIQRFTESRCPPVVATIHLANHDAESQFTTVDIEIIAEMQRAAMADRTFTLQLERDTRLDTETWVSIDPEDEVGYVDWVKRKCA